LQVRASLLGARMHLLLLLQRGYGFTLEQFYFFENPI
jgi:hypothetical protein